METDALNQLWADLMVEELVRCGTELFCIAPGSRSTPLAVAVGRNGRARLVVHYDERGTAFYALGSARATGRPAAWITTSGTAVANGLPAVVEASSDGVPMILLTADRPPELRATGANQTIDQVGIFGGYVRWAVDLPAPESSLDPALLLTTIDQAIHRATSAPRGPVHINCMYRKPLGPPAADRRGEVPGSLAAWYAGSGPFTQYAGGRPAPDDGELAQVWDQLHRAERGLIVAGRLKHPDEGDAVKQLARAMGWPLLADIGSQLRLGCRDVIGTYDAIIAGAFSQSHAPDAVLHFGGRATSKRLQQYLDRHRPERYAIVREEPWRLDPNHQVTHVLQADVVQTCRTLQEMVPQQDAGRAWRERWRRAHAAAEEVLEEWLAGPELTEPSVARKVSQLIPEGHGLFLASSMPIRDMDAFSAVRASAIRVAANRGASGIDGTVASGAGFAAGLGAPVTLLIGDLALLHDLNSLYLLRDAPVVVVLINNGGGGIFSFLPIASETDVFEQLFASSHDRRFAAAAEMFGLQYEAPKTLTAFAGAYERACRRHHPTIIEVSTDRSENAAYHRDILSAVNAAVIAATTET